MGRLPASILLPICLALPLLVLPPAIYAQQDPSAFHGRFHCNIIADPTGTRTCLVAGNQNANTTQIEFPAGAWNISFALGWTPAVQGASQLRLLVERVDGPHIKATESGPSGIELAFPNPQWAGTSRWNVTVEEAVPAQAGQPSTNQPFTLWYNHRNATERDEPAEPQTRTPEPNRPRSTDVPTTKGSEDRVVPDPFLSLPREGGGRYTEVAGWKDVALVVSPLLLLALFPRAVRASIWQVLLGAYARLREEAVRGHPRRRLLLDLVSACAGISESEARRELGWARGVLEHHARMLMAHHLIHRIESGGRTFLTLPGQLVDANPLRRKILEAVNARPGIEIPLLSAKIQAPSRAVRRLVLTMSRRGEIVRKRGANAVRCYPAANAAHSGRKAYARAV